MINIKSFNMNKFLVKGTYIHTYTHTHKYIVDLYDSMIDFAT